ncbi:MAG: ROK family protein [Chloroflexota bacterium]|nr:ROK family protein [Chloroflexota bacterium]
MAEMILGVEIGGTKQQLALGTTEGEILALRRGHVDPELGADGIRYWLKENIPDFIEEQKEDKGFAAPKAIGCGFGGPINSLKGRVLRSFQIEGWLDFPIQDWFEATFELPAIVDNDSNAAAWAEYVRGFGRGTQNFFYTNIGSGVGGGFVFDGRLYDGQGYGAGELGHTLAPDFTATASGAVEKVENLCSGWSVEQRLHTPGYIPETSALFRPVAGELAAISTRDLGEAARAGDNFALTEIGWVARTFGIALVNVLSLTNVERIAIGGGVANLGDVLIDPIRETVEKRVFASSQGHYEIRACELGEEIVLVGALLRAGARLACRERWRFIGSGG